MLDTVYFAFINLFSLLLSLLPMSDNISIEEIKDLCEKLNISIEEIKDLFEKLSHKLSRALRHEPPNKKGIRGDGSGYTRLDLLRASLPKKLQMPELSFDEFLDVIKKIVLADGKQRFSLRAFENGVYYIRANQGHSGEWVKNLKPWMIYQVIAMDNYRKLCNSPVIIHGTNPIAYGEIKASGVVRRMGRLGIHFAPRNGAKSGRRSSASVLLCFNIEQLLKYGLHLYLSDNDVVLCPDDVPIEMATCLLSDDQGKTWRNEATGETFPECEINAKLGIEPTAATVEPEAEACAVADSGAMLGYLPKVAATNAMFGYLPKVAATSAMLGYLPKADTPVIAPTEEPTAATDEPVVELKLQYLSAAILLGQPLVEPAVATAEPSETEPLDAATDGTAVVSAVGPFI